MVAAAVDPAVDPVFEVLQSVESLLLLVSLLWLTSLLYFSIFAVVGVSAVAVVLMLGFPPLKVKAPLGL